MNNDIPLFVIGLPKDDFAKGLLMSKFKHTLEKGKKILPEIIETKIAVETQNPEMMQALMQNQQMMEGTMNSGMMMGSNAIEQHERILELMETMMNDKGIMNHMFAHMMENEQILHKMFALMDNSPSIKEHMAAHVSGDLSEYEHLDNMHDDQEHEHEDEHQ